jgi:hypothetical protein
LHSRTAKAGELGGGGVWAVYNTADEITGLESKS